MFKNPLATLVIGVIVGLAVGYVLGERQAVPPVAVPPASQAGLPDGHPPLNQGQPNQAGASRAAAGLEAAVSELGRLLEASPDDVGLMVQMGNAYFDGERWNEAREWYEKALEQRPDDPDVLTDLAIVYRGLHRHEESLAKLRRAVEINPDHWQAWYNTVVVLHTDMGRTDEAREALATLKVIAARNPSVPDLSGIEASLGS
jgi:tetratricopeptide (TPR) repeat protein